MMAAANILILSIFHRPYWIDEEGTGTILSLINLMPSNTIFFAFDAACFCCSQKTCAVTDICSYLHCFTRSYLYCIINTHCTPVSGCSQDMAPSVRPRTIQDLFKGQPCRASFSTRSLLGAKSLQLLDRYHIATVLLAIE